MVVFGLALCSSPTLSQGIPQGTWTASFRNADFARLTPNGIRAICRDEVPPECEQEVPNGVNTYNISGTTFSTNYVHLQGITTRNASAELMPSCAAAGIYPVQFGLAMPGAKILSYNLATRRLIFEDFRRPGESNCMLVNYQRNGGSSILNVYQRVTFEGAIDALLESGPSFGCASARQCSVTGNQETGVLSLAFSNTFNLTCSAGACMT
eukprot:g6222.t1